MAQVYTYKWRCLKVKGTHFSQNVQKGKLWKKYEKKGTLGLIKKGENVQSSLFTKWLIKWLINYA